MSESTVTKRKPVGKDISTRRRVAKARRHFRLRKKVNGTAERPRLAVHRSSKHITVQIIDDLKGHTIASASSMEADVRALDGDKKARAAKVGQLAAARAKDSRRHGGRFRPRWQRVPRPHRGSGRRCSRGGAGVLTMIITGIERDA